MKTLIATKYSIKVKFSDMNTIQISVIDNDTGEIAVCSWNIKEPAKRVGKPTTKGIKKEVSVDD